MRRTKQVRTGRRGTHGRAAAAFEAFEFVGVEKIDLPITDRMHNGPMIPHPASHADEYDSFAAAVKE